ncbi:uncharacterized protein [Dermacentor andersoni]|uniref:uncharacterized protein n=1 Tax=Dermacentor andersoni TaxID=34620 RepID=UPI002155F8A8|nr:uncharacterized protein LOC126534597 [Dermacentor andersoni]
MQFPAEFLVFTTLIFSCVFCDELDLKPGCTKEMLDACGSDYLVYSNVTSLPEDGKEFEENCVFLQMQISCTLEFAKKCLDGIPRVAIIIGLQSMEEEYEAICTEGTEQNENYRKSINCMNKAGKGLKQCQAKMRDDMEIGALVAPRDKITGYACCAYHANQDCFDNALQDCSGTPAQELMRGIMEKVFGEPLSLICGHYSRDSDACRSLPQLAPPTDSKDFGKKGLVELAIEHAGSVFNKH